MTAVNAETGEIESATVNYEVHPVAALFPFITGEAFVEFVQDIRVNGQREPVVLDANGRLLDGRNRARACQALGMDVKETRYSGDDAEAWIISHNVHRRHLTDSQRAMVAAKLANLRNGEQARHAPSIDGASVPITTAAAAKALNVSVTSVERARVVRDHGTPEVQEAVESGRLTVSRAAEAIKTARAPEPPKVDRRSAEERIEQITALASRGATSGHIAKELGIGIEQVRALANRHDISIPADVVRGRTRRIDHGRILDNVTEATEVAAMSLRDIDAAQLDREAALERLDSLTASINALSKAVKKIRESFHD